MVPPGSLSPEQRAEVESGCYLMLMVLSDAVARPLPGEDARGQAEESLAILDRTTATRPPTAAFHLRRADSLERRGDARAAGLERARAAGLEPADAFDDLLLGRERFLKGDWDTARSHFDAALSRRPDLFWARCLLAIAELNSAPPRPAEAKTELTTCLLAQPSSAWLYLLRGSAYGQMGVTLGVAARASGHGSRLAAEAEARFKDAEADFRKAHQLGLDQSLGYVLLMNRGVMRFQRGTLPEAAADFEKAIALDKGRYNAYASLAQVLRKLGRKAEAVERLDRAIALEPRLAALYRGRALARLDGAAPTPGEAEASFATWRPRPASSRPAAVRRPTTTPAAAGCCSVSTGPRMPWPPPTPLWHWSETWAGPTSSGSPPCSPWSGTPTCSARVTRHWPRGTRPPSSSGSGALPDSGSTTSPAPSTTTPRRWPYPATTELRPTATAGGRTCFPTLPSWPCATSTPRSASTRATPTATPAGHGAGAARRSPRCRHGRRGVHPS